MEYLTFNEFQKMGGELSLSAFNFYQLKSKNKIDKYTLGRIKTMEEIPDEVKNCMYILIIMFNSIDNGVDKSENFINYSEDELESKFLNVIEENLLSTGLMYRGL